MGLSALKYLVPILVRYANSERASRTIRALPPFGMKSGIYAWHLHLRQQLSREGLIDRTDQEFRETLDAREVLRIGRGPIRLVVL
jgi:hypothetical protein